VVATFYGTPLYLSPELCEHSAYNQKTDIWALGVILSVSLPHEEGHFLPRLTRYELASLSHPFKGASLAQIGLHPVDDDHTDSPAMWSPLYSPRDHWR